MSIFSFITNLFAPATKLIDEISTTDEERLKLRNELARIQQEVHAKTTDLMIAEVKSEHWIVAAWRPLCVLLLISLIIADAYGWAKAPDQIYELANLFLTTYAGSRGLEKISRNLKK